VSERLCRAGLHGCLVFDYNAQPDVIKRENAALRIIQGAGNAVRRFEFVQSLPDDPA
jgi:hypothetical protein